jgi:phosphoribosyl 1,2-cyclic phosphodiesterase
VFDAGSGIRALGDRLRSNGVVDADLFLTHFHWDHIQGLPFFSPLYDAGTRLGIHGPPQEGASLTSLIAGVMAPVYFPVPYEAIAARIEYADIAEDEEWTRGDVTVQALRVRHPSFTVGYRVSFGGARLLYVPDNELRGAEYPVRADWEDRFRDFIADADILIHDAMFTATEYRARAGWGHSAYEQVIRMAEAAGVRQLVLFHHAPERADVELDGVVDELREGVERRGSGLELVAAEEGSELLVEERAS